MYIAEMGNSGGKPLQLHPGLKESTSTSSKKASTPELELPITGT